MAKVSVDKELLERCRAAWGYATYEETVEKALKRYIKKLKMDREQERIMEIRRRELEERDRKQRGDEPRP